MNNRLYYGDNLQVLREEIRDESIDLIYLDLWTRLVLVVLIGGLVGS